MLLALLFFFTEVSAQKKIKVYGTVYTATGAKTIDFATVSMPDFNLIATTDASGRYALNNVPIGKVRIVVKYLGMQDIDTTVVINKDRELDFSLREENFHLTEVVVTARNNTSGKTTSSYITRNAIDHLQANSLADLMALTPGGISHNQNLNNAQSLNIRQVEGGDGSAMNSLGTAVVQDGAPISNNANMSVLAPTVAGSSVALSGGASASSGIDARGISTENIESVEIIRGIPSVEYGDLTSGAVILHTKAGREPLRINAKANPRVYQASIGTGFELGNRAGALNLSGDYAYNTNVITSSNVHYQRINVKALYSNQFFDNKLRSNTSLSFLYGKDQRDPNVDDTYYMIKSHGETYGIILNTNGLWTVNKGWLQNIKYVLSGSYTSKQSLSEQNYYNANSPYSGTYSDGAVLSNTAGKHIYDYSGNEITNFGSADESNYAHYLPSTYLGQNKIDSREVNFFGKLTATFFRNFGKVNNGILLGIDFKSDGNEGNGTSWSVDNPPYRNVSNTDASYRPRSYKNIPYINTFGAFVQDNFKLHLGRHEFNLDAGLRFDNTSVAGSVWSPRFNASYFAIPEVLRLRGGYGITAKMPTLYYLYPQNAYFEYINFNNLSDTNIPESDRLFITTTRVQDAQNKDLKIAKNYKSEVGFDLYLGKMSLSVTGFIERMKNGYGMGQKFLSALYNKYALNADGQLEQSGSYPVLSQYYSPVNSLNSKTRGVEFDLNLGRIDAIRTSFQLNGAWMRIDSHSNDLLYYDNSTSEPSTRKDIAIYDNMREETHSQQCVTTLRATHNIPSIGFVITLTAQAIWNQSEWTSYYNDSIPVGYLSLQNGLPTYFSNGQFATRQDVIDAGYSHLLRNVSHTAAICETVSPYFQFNINVTKEIGDIARISFFANNMFRSYPRFQSKRYPGTYNTYNSDFYFGVELSLKL